MSLFLRSLLLVLLDVRSELGDPMESVSVASLRQVKGNALFLGDHLPFYRLLIVRSAACGTQTVHVVLDIVEAELAHL